MILFLTALVFIGPRCSEDFLKPEPLSFYAPENTFVNAEGFNAALIACLRNARHEMYGDTPPFISEGIFSDIAVEGTTDKTGIHMDMPAVILPDANFSYGDVTKLGRYWTEAYNRIKYANVVISRIDNAEWKSDAERNNILGKAYFHRANVYYRLVHQFGDVPLILEEITQPRLDFYSCTRESILQKCKKDLDFAAQWVDADAPVGDINKAAVNHLLTKVNMSLLEFDDAIASANAVINDGIHSLMTTRFGSSKNDPTHDLIWDLHQEENKALAENTETIWLFVCSETMTEDGASEKLRIMRQAVPYWGGAGKVKTPTGQTGTTDQPGGALVGGFPVEIDQVGMYGRGIGRLRPSPWYQHDLWDDPNDMRHKYPNWIRMEDLVYNVPGLKANGDPYYNQHLQLFDAGGGILCTDTIRSWFDWPHYKLYVIDPTDNTPDGGFGDWYEMRLAETYLLRSEAYFWNDQPDLAADDLNAVRVRAGCSPYTSDQINIGTILDERARELYYEEKRKTELTRIAYILAKTGKPCYNGKTYSMNSFGTDNFWYDRVIEKNVFYRDNVRAPFYNYRVAPYIVLWPVLSSAINANSLGHINQNFGYPGFESNVTPMKWVDGEGEGSIVEQ
ncbi:MAG: RagB/SusD family nutrient uptake outer membrane protein [Bacteroidales bacterium]|nr:RagB/SusD family nutrient uptake outer membrane protein [Bacteroidales bacterium]